MIRYCFLLIFVALTLCSYSLPQNDDYSLYKKAVAENDSLKKEETVLSSRQKELNSQLSALKKEIEKKKSESAKEERRLKELQEKYDQSEAHRLETQKGNLLNEISLVDNEIGKLGNEARKLEAEYTVAANKESKLNEVKEGVSKKLLDEYRPYLKKPFSSMKMEELRNMQNHCKTYMADAAIKSFVNELGQTMISKEKYDRAIKVLDSRYDASSVSNAANALKEVNCVTESQKHEVSTVLDALQCFKSGLDTFKEFISKLNDRREKVGSSSLKTLKDCQKYVYSKDPSLENRIRETMYPVPYLIRSYENYWKMLENSPASHPQIEKEILEQ